MTSQQICAFWSAVTYFAEMAVDSWQGPWDHLTCNEAEALAEVLLAAGHGEAARCLAARPCQRGRHRRRSP